MIIFADSFPLFSTLATFPCKSKELPYATDFELNLQMESEFREDCYASAETSLHGLTLFNPSPLTSVLLYKSYMSQIVPVVLMWILKGKT